MISDDLIRIAADVGARVLEKCLQLFQLPLPPLGTTGEERPHMHAAAYGCGERVQDRSGATSLLGRQDEALHGIGGHGSYRALFLAFFQATDFTPAVPVS